METHLAFQSVAGRDGFWVAVKRNSKNERLRRHRDRGARGCNRIGLAFNVSCHAPVKRGDTFHFSRKGAV